MAHRFQPGQEVLILRGNGKHKRWRKGYVYVGYTENSVRWNQGYHLLVKKKKAHMCHLILEANAVKANKKGE